MKSTKYQSLSLSRLRSLLLELLKSNCQREPWYSTALDLVERSDWKGLVSWSELPLQTYDGGALSYFAHAQIVACIKKFPFSPKLLGTDPRAKALETFEETERRCKKTNRRLERAYDGRHPSRYLAVLERARRIIESVIGERPDLPAIYQKCHFSSGASLGIHGERTNLIRKMTSGKLTCTPSALPYALAAFSTDDSFVEMTCRHSPDTLVGRHRRRKQRSRSYGSRQNFVDTRRNDAAIYCHDAYAVKHSLSAHVIELRGYNLLGFVTKTYKTHRIITVGPSADIYLQNGVGDELRSLLLEVGVDLTDQSKNQRLARRGSITGCLATIDLRSASDTIARLLVKKLLPTEWYRFLDAIRSPAYKLSRTSQEVTYEKFVSQGNGFCFPLETLIFWALCKAVAPRGATVSAYGDDLIVPTDSYEEIVRVLQFAGFEPNTAKSFTGSHPFRESCGADWYLGVDVRPLYLKRELSGKDPFGLLIAHNVSQLGDGPRPMFWEEGRQLLKQWGAMLPRRPIWARQTRRLKNLLAGNELLYRITGTWEDRGKQPDREILLRSLNGAFDVEIDEFMTSRSAKWNRRTSNWEWSEMKMSPVPDDVSDVPERDLARYYAFLNGSEAGEVHLRRRYTTRVTSIKPMKDTHRVRERQALLQR